MDGCVLKYVKIRMIYIRAVNDDDGDDDDDADDTRS